MARGAANNIKAIKISIADTQKVFRGLVESREKADFYRFQLSAASDFNLRLSQLKADANVLLRSESGQLIAQSRRPKRKSERISARLEIGTYHIQVKLSGKRATSYRLQVKAPAASATPTQPPTQPPTPAPQKFQRSWLRQLGTPGNDQGFSIAVSSSQDVYIAGQTAGALATSAGQTDAFVAKYNDAGNQIWLRQSGTDLNDGLFNIAIDSNNNLYGAGAASLSTATGASDAYLVKYSSDGGLLFDKQLDIGGSETALGIAVNSSDNPFLVGSITSINLTAFSIEIDGFLAQYDSAGNVVNSRQLDLTKVGTAVGIAIDAQNNLYISGFTNATTTFDASNPILGEDAFVAKYDSTGQVVWFKTIETAQKDLASRVAVDLSGNIYVAGETAGSLPGNSNQGGTDAFIAKYEGNGNLQWLKQFGTSGKDTAEDIAIDAAGQIYAAGETAGSLFGDSYSGGSDAWLTLFNSQGNKIISTQFGTSLDDKITSLKTGAGNIYLAGETRGDLDGSNQGGLDAWLAKYSLSPL